MRLFIVALCLLSLTGCGTVYRHSTVRSHTSDDQAVRVIPINAENLLLANRTPYIPKALPAAFSRTAGTHHSKDTGPTADLSPAISTVSRPVPMETRIPPANDPGPYKIGVGDVVILATPQMGSTVEQLSGLLAAQNERQGYTVQDDGAIAIPNVGRVQLAGKTLEEAEADVFQALVKNQIDPTFSLEVSQFNSQKVSIGGDVKNPGVVPITLTPLYLDQALAAVGGVTVTDDTYASVRIYRDGQLYQIPLKKLYSEKGLPKIRLLSGDSVFIDQSYNLDLAQAYFQEQISLSGARNSSLNALNAEITIRRNELDEIRSNYEKKEALDAVDRDYVYLTGEVTKQGRFTLPYGHQATLADALYSSGGISPETGDVSQIYVLRKSQGAADGATITAWHLDARNASNMVYETQFQLRPGDIVFVAEQPITVWGRAVSQFTPSLITSPTAAAINN